MVKHQKLNPKSQINPNLQKISSKRYDLEERTLRFSYRIITLSHKIPKNSVNRILVNQLIRSGTSIGANYREANETDTKRDFKHRIRIAKKEAKETMYWLNILKHANPNASNLIIPSEKEAEELMKILASIYKKAQ